mgnify:CR=1 FL=1
MSELYWLGVLGNLHNFCVALAFFGSVFNFGCRFLVSSVL